MSFDLAAMLRPDGPPPTGRIDLRKCQPCRDKMLATMRAKTAPSIWFLERPTFRTGLSEAIIARLCEAGCKIRTLATCAERPPKRKARALIDLMHAEGAPDYLIRWDEHGQQWWSPTWQRVVNACYERGTVPLSLDFGYFDHYASRVLTRYLPGDGAPERRLSIAEEWPNVGPAPVKPVHPRLAGYFNRMAEVRQEALDAGPMDANGPYVCVWSSYSGWSLRGGPFWPEDGSKTTALRKTCDAVQTSARRAVIKRSPCPHGPEMPDAYEVVRGCDPLTNARMALHAEFNVIWNSSVSNELLLWGVPVHAMGRSWYTGLGVFGEPQSWEALGVVPRVNHNARARYRAWWCDHIFYPLQSVHALKEATPHG